MFALGLLCALGAWGDSTSVTVSNPPQATTVTGNSPQTMTFPVARSGDINYPLWLNYQTVDVTATAGVDYTAATGPIKLAASASSSGIPVTISGSTTNKSDRTLNLQLLGGVGVGPDASFASPQTFPTGKAPLVITQVDLNGDGKLDLIVANTGATNNVPDNTVSVLVNTTAPGAATPSYAPQQTFSTGNGPVVAIPVDVNGDGKPDLVIPNNKDNTVSVLLNTTATGAASVSFAAQKTFPTGVGSAGLSTPDLNGDGRPDLVVSNNGAGVASVSVLLNTTPPGSATASFATQQTFAVGEGAGASVSFDVNGDGKPDVVVANYKAAAGSTLSVLLNTTTPGAAAASFATQQVFDGGLSPLLLSSGDLNGDGKPDLVVSNLHVNGFSLDVDTVNVMFNTTTPGSATASFTAAKTLDSSQSSFNVADVNGDGKPDLVGTDVIGNKVNVLLNTMAPGGLVPSFAKQTINATGNPGSVQVVDLNGDGKPDVAFAGAGGNVIGVLLNTTPAPATVLGNNSYAAQQTFGAGTQPASVVSADVNGDGKPDLVVANQGSSNVSVLLNTTLPGAASPSYAAQQPFTTGTGPQSVAVADVNGDGKRDLVVANQGANTISVLLNTTAPGAATPSYASQQPFPAGTAPQSVAVGDLNGDGVADVAAVNTGGGISVLLNTTAPGAVTSSFAAAQPFTAGTSGRSITAADLNGDGRLDLVALSPADGTVLVLFNTTAPGATTASFTAAQAFATVTGNPGSNPYAVVAADVNGDGRRDLIISNVGSASVSVLLNSTVAGSNTPGFLAAQGFGVGTNPHGVSAADVDGDGKLDLLVANGAGNTVSVLRNTTAPGATTPSFASHQDFAVGAGSTGLGVTDGNGDGRPDLVVANATDSNVSVLLSAQYVATVGMSATGTIHYDVPQTKITLDKTTLAFGSQPVATSSSPQTVTVTNSGTAPLNVGGVTVNGSNPSDFSQTNTCTSGAIAPNDSCTINVTFTPSAINTRSASLNIASNDPTGTKSVALSGSGTAAGVAFNPTSLSFGNQPVGSTSAIKTITLTNNGNGTLNINSILASGDFAQSNDCTASLAVSANCTISVTFHPTAGGTRNGTVSVSSNAPGSPHTASFSGTGTQPAVMVQSSAIFADQVVGTTSSPAQSISVKNTGAAPLNVGTPTISGTNQSEFAISGNTCTSPVAANGTCAISVTFTPASAGSRTATLNIPSDAPSSPNAVGLSGKGLQATLSVAGTVGFGNQVTGTTSTAKAITINNAGTSGLNVGAPTLSGANASDYSISNNGCVNMVAPNGSCDISVTFTPGTAGARAATLNIPSNAPTSPDHTNLTGTGVAPGYVLQASGTMGFGNQLVGTTSAAQTITITNTGNVATTVAGVVNGNAAEFAIGVDNCTNKSLAINGTCTISFTFSPAAAGTRSASVTVNGGANPSGTSANFMLTGTGTQPALSAPASATFGNQAVGTTSAAQDLTVTNSGTAPLNVGSPSVAGTNAGDFSISGNTCTVAIVPNGTCKISLTFTPAMAGARGATLSIPSNAPGSPKVVNLSGAGAQAALSVASTVNFANQLVGTTSAPKAVTVTNTGTSGLNVGTPTLTGANLAEYAISGNTCTATVAPNGTCTISVTFTPGAEGTRTAALNIPSNAPTSPDAVSLSGSGVTAVATLSVTPPALSFGDQAMSATSAALVLQVKNTGNAALNVGTPALSGANASDFAVSGNTCTGAIAINATCNISVTFTPAVLGARAASLSIPSNDPQSPKTVNLSGNGVQPSSGGGGGATSPWLLLVLGGAWFARRKQSWISARR